MKLAGKEANLPTGAVTINLSNPLAEGDIINITGFQNKNATDKTVTLYMGFDKGDAIKDNANWKNLINDATYANAEKPETKSYTVSAKNAGSKVITLTRNAAGTNLCISKIEITREEAAPATISKDVTFDFNASTHAVSASASTDGDILSDESLTQDGVTLTISPKTSGNYENRYWSTPNGPQLRMYSGTITISAPRKTITKIVVNNSKWNTGNTFNEVAAAKGEWTGSASQVTLAIAANTQINSIVVTLEEGVAATMNTLPQILTFPDYNLFENASYLTDDAHVWTADVNGAVWTFRGFNNQNNAWNYIACGRKSTAVTTTITSPRMGAVVKDVVFTVDETANVEKAELVIYDEFDMTVGEPIDITSDWAAGEVDVQVEGDIDYVYQLVLTNKAGANGSTKISKVALYGEGGYTHILKAANIAAFNALTANDVAELTLTDAKVLAAGNKNIIVEDATGRLNIYDIALDAKVGQVLNGKLIGSYTLYNGMNEMKKAEKTDVAAVTITDGEAPVAKAVTLAEAQTADNALALVTIADAVVKVEGKNTYAVIGEEQMQLYDTFKSGYKLKNGDKINSMTGIVIPYKNIFELAPRTLEDMDIEEFVEPTPQPQPGETGTATYAVQVDETHKAGESVDVKTADEETVATLTFGFEGGQDFKAAKAHSGVEGFVAFTEGNGENGAAEAGTTYIITPQYDGEIEVGVVLNAGKSFFVLEDGTALADYNGIKVEEKLYGTYKFNVAAAKTYKVYCTGSKLGFYGFNYTFTKPAEPQPAGNDRKWTFTEWSAETVANLKADAAASAAEGWSDIEKKDATAPTEISKDNCFWAATTPNEDGQLTANGVVIEELKGLKFNADYTAARSLAIAVNYPTTSLGDYAGPAYLWLGGKNMECFTIPNVTAGSTITIEVESHKPTDARGIRLYKQFNTAAARSNRAVDEANLIGELIPTTKEAKTFTVDEDCDVVVKHTNGCHIYTIEVKGTEPVGPVEPTIEDGIYDLTPDMFKTWDGIAADSKATEDKPHFEQHVNENVNPGATVYGNGSVSYLTYANITAYDKLVIEGTPGMQIRILLNRLEVGNGGGDANGGALNEINKTLDETGVAEISLADMDAARLNAIKLGWGSAAGVIYKMAVIKGNIGYVPTGINTVKANAFENGTVYNLRGQKVTNPTKGLYIINGKKVMVK